MVVKLSAVAPESSRKLKFPGFMTTAQDGGKVVSRGPESSRKLKFTGFMTTAEDGGKVVSTTYQPPLPPRKCSWYSFLLEAESTPGP
jgi:hypothetical protein